MAFTTWTALHQSLLDRLADFAAGQAFLADSVEVGEKKIAYRNIAELKTAIEYVSTMASFESGAAVGRTYAKPVRPR